MFTSSFEVKPKYIERVEKLAMICSTDIEDNINELLRNKGWNEVLYSKFCKAVLDIVCKYIHNLDEAQLCEADLNHMLKQKKRNEKVFLKLLDKKTFNFFDVVLKDRKVKFFKNIDLLKELYKLRAEGVGLGEVFLTLFSECESPVCGDIKVGKYIIELKGEKGILGCEGYWNEYLKDIKHIYNKSTNNEALKHIITMLASGEYDSGYILEQLRTEDCPTITGNKWVRNLRKDIEELIECEHIVELMIAVQIYSYYINNQFDKIIFVNGPKALCINYGKLKDIYDQLKGHEFHISATNQYARNKGLSITFKN